MTSQQQLEANRANAKLSTGPRTPEGKAASARNATTHGLFSAHFSVPDADRDAFDDLRASFFVEIEPIGILEQTEFDTLVEAAWKLQVIRRQEKQALEQNEANPEQILDRFSRYATRFQRIYQRAMTELRRLQTERSIRQAAENAPRDIAPLADSACVKKQTQPPPRQDGMDDYARRLMAEATWANAQIRAIRFGVPPPPRNELNGAGDPSARGMASC